MAFLDGLSARCLPQLLLETEGGSNGNTTQIILLIAGGIVLMLLMMRLTRKRHQMSRQQHASDRSRERPDPRGDAVLQTPPRGNPEVERLYVDLQEFAREVEGRLDTKITYLRQLILEADRAGQNLERLLEDRARDDSGGKAAPPADSASRDSSPASPSPQDDAGVEEEATTQEEEVLGQRLDVTVGDDDDRPALDAGAGETEASAPDPAERVWSLHEAGQTPATIAEQTGLPEGEVELIINLRQSAKRPEETS